MSDSLLSGLRFSDNDRKELQKVFSGADRIGSFSTEDVIAIPALKTAPAAAGAKCVGFGLNKSLCLAQTCGHLRCCS